MRLELGLDIKTIYFNARNLRNKLDEVWCFVTAETIDIIIINLYTYSKQL